MKNLTDFINEAKQNQEIDENYQIDEATDILQSLDVLSAEDMKCLIASAIALAVSGTMVTYGIIKDEISKTKKNLVPKLNKLVNESAADAIQQLLTGVASEDLKHISLAIITAIGAGGALTFAKLREVLRDSKLSKSKIDKIEQSA